MNDYFVPRRTKIPHATPNYAPGKSKFEFDYYRQTYCYIEKLAHIWGKLEEPGQEVIYFSKCFNSRYMEFVVYETHEPLIWTSGEGSTNTNTIIKQGTPKWKA